MPKFVNTVHPAGTVVTNTNIDTAGSGDIANWTTGGTSTFVAGGGIELTTAAAADLPRMDIPVWTAAKKRWLRTRWKQTGTNPAGTITILNLRSGGGGATLAAGFAAAGNTNVYRVMNGSNTAAGTACPAWNAVGEYLVDFYVEVHPTAPTTSNGRVLVRVRCLSDSTWNGGQDWIYDTGQTFNVGTADLTAARFGKTSGNVAFTSPPSFFEPEWEPLSLPAYDPANPLAAAASLPAHASDPTGPTYPAIVPGSVAHIGDSTSEQDGFGPDRIAVKYEQIGIPAAKRFIYAKGSKRILDADANGFTTSQNIDQARAALGGEAETYVIQLGSNGHRDDGAENQARVAAVLDKINPAATVIWVGISQVNGYVDGSNTEATRLNFNTVAKAVVTARPNGRWADWNAHIDRIGDTGIWGTDGVHHPTYGYLVKNRFYADQVRPAYRRGRQLAHA